MNERKKYNMSIDLGCENTVVVLDANAWLDLYTIPPVALEAVVDVIREHRDIFWIPNQVYREYCRNEKMKKEQIEKLFVNARSNSLSALSMFKDKTLQQLTTLRKKNQLTDDVFKSQIQEKIKDLEKFIKNGYATLNTNYEEEIKIIKNEDIVNALVEEIYNNSKADDFTIIEKMRICEEGEIRYKYKIAPGYTDDGKANNKEDYFRKYGDLIIWKEILNKVNKFPINTIFVQNEKKQDWLAEKGGTILAQELLEEYSVATKGDGIIEVCNFEGFLDNYGEDLGLQVVQIEQLVQQLKFEREVYDYINDKKSAIAYSKLENYFNDDYALYEVINQFGWISVYGGNFEDVDNAEVHSINIESCSVEYEKEISLYTLNTCFEVQGNTDIEEYVGRDASYVGNVDFSVTGWLRQDIIVVYDNPDRTPELGFEIVSDTIEVLDIEFYNESDFDVKLKDD